MKLAKQSLACANKQGSNQYKQHLYNNSLTSQRQRLLAWVQQENITTFQARARGIPHPAGRVNELRQAGHKIILNWVREADENGVEHRIGQYVYLGKNNNKEKQHGV